MAITREDMGALFHGALNTPEEFYQDAVRLHKKWYLWGAGSLVALIAIYVVMSYMEMPSVIAVMNAALILVLGFYASAPATFLALFGGGAGGKLVSYNWSWRNIFADEEFVFPDIQLSEVAKQGWKTYVAALKLPAHFLILAIAAGAVLILLRIERPMYAMVFFPIMAAIGLWAFVHASKTDATTISQIARAVWYKRITIVILVAGALASFYQAFAGPSLNDLTYKKTFPVEVRHLNGQQVCGIRPGERTFTVPKTVYVTIGGEFTEISAYILMNGRPHGERFSVNNSGCAELSFAFTSEGRTQSIAPQVIFVTIE